MKSAYVVTWWRNSFAAFLAVLLALFPSFGAADGSGHHKRGHYQDGYVFYEIGTDLIDPFVNDINNKRQVIGFHGAFDGHVQVFVWEKGKMRFFDYPDAVQTFGNGLNDKGIKAGHAIIGDLSGAYENRAWVKAGKFFIDVTFKPFNSWAFDINNKGGIVGIYCVDSEGATPGCLNDLPAPFFPPPNETYHAWMLNKYGYRTIDPPGSVLAAGFGINDRGDAVGGFSDAYGDHGFVRDKTGHYTIVDIPGAIFTEIRGINNKRITVGRYFNDEPPWYPDHGFIRKRNGEFVTIDYPGAFATFVNAINEHGDLAGIYFTENFENVKSFVAFRKKKRRHKH